MNQGNTELLIIQSRINYLVVDCYPGYILIQSTIKSWIAIRTTINQEIRGLTWYHSVEIFSGPKIGSVAWFQWWVVDKWLRRSFDWQLINGKEASQV